MPERRKCARCRGASQRRSPTSTAASTPRAAERQGSSHPRARWRSASHGSVGSDTRPTRAISWRWARRCTAGPRRALPGRASGTNTRARPRSRCPRRSGGQTPLRCKRPTPATATQRRPTRSWTRRTGSSQPSPRGRGRAAATASTRRRPCSPFRSLGCFHPPRSPAPLPAAAAAPTARPRSTTGASRPGRATAHSAPRTTSPTSEGSASGPRGEASSTPSTTASAGTSKGAMAAVVGADAPGVAG